MLIIKRNNRFLLYDICYDGSNNEEVRRLGKIKYRPFLKNYGFYPSFFLSSIGKQGMSKINSFIEKINKRQNHAR